MLPAGEAELDVIAEDAERESGGSGCSGVVVASMAAVTECDLRLEEEEEEEVVWCV
jgi:hypothetical protein